MLSQQIEEKLHRYLNYLEQDKTNINLWLSISDSYIQLTNWPLAQQYLNGAKEVSGDSLFVHQGSLYLKSNQIERAIAVFQCAVNEEDNPIHRYYLAFSLYVDYKFDDALTVLTSSSDPLILPESHRLKAKLLHHLQKLEESIACLEDYMLDNSTDAEAAGYLSLLYFDKGNIEKSTVYSSLALTINPDNYEGQLIKILLKARDSQLTLMELEPLIANQPEDGRLLFVLGTTQLQELKVNAAEQSFLKVSNIWPDFYENWMCLGWVYVLQNKLDKAEHAYQQAIKIDPDDANSLGGLALINALLKKTAKAKQQLKKTQQIDPSCFMIKITQLLLANKANPAEVRRLFEAALPEIVIQMKKSVALASLTHGTIH